MTTLHIEGNFLDCETPELLVYVHPLQQQFRDRIKQLLYGCFNKDARTPNRYNQGEYPFTENGRIFLYCTVPIAALDQQFIDNITSVLYIIPENDHFMIYNVCKIDNSPPMSLLFDYMIRRWEASTNVLVPAPRLSLGVDIWNLHFKKAFDLYVRNKFSYYGVNNNIILLEYDSTLQNGNSAQAEAYRQQLLEFLLQQGQQSLQVERLMALRWFGKKYSKKGKKDKKKGKSKVKK